MPDLSSSPAVSATLSRALDTVAAVSTPPGRGGVALIRISGPDAAGIGRRIFFPAGAAHPDERPRTAVYGRIRRPGGAAPGEYIDTGLAVFFRAPGSFTGEDTLEITCHGGILVTRAVLAAALAAGARQAERGEFTRRAFASGRIDLTEAEALGLLIDAGTDAQLRLSHSGMNGKLAEACSSLRDGITSLLADIYVRIDFPEEDLGSMPDAELAERLLSLTEKTDALRMSYRTGRAVAEGIPAVICGNTNTGKSTLFNRFTGRDDAIVTDIAGTTRDTLTAKVAAGDVTLLLSDTAGIHGGPADPVEAIGMDCFFPAPCREPAGRKRGRDGRTALEVGPAGAPRRGVAVGDFSAQAPRLPARRLGIRRPCKDDRRALHRRQHRHRRGRRRRERQTARRPRQGG